MPLILSDTCVRDSAMHKRSLQNEAILVNHNLVSVKLTAKGYLFQRSVQIQRLKPICLKFTDIKRGFFE